MHTEGFASLEDGDVGCALVVFGVRVALLKVVGDVGIRVGEDARFMVGAGYGVVTNTGGAGCLFGKSEYLGACERAIGLTWI